MISVLASSEVDRGFNKMLISLARLLERLDETRRFFKNLWLNSVVLEEDLI
jgi:hypothetical protein